MHVDGRETIHEFAFHKVSYLDISTSKTKRRFHEPELKPLLLQPQLKLYLFQTTGEVLVVAAVLKDEWPPQKRRGREFPDLCQPAHRQRKRYVRIPDDTACQSQLRVPVRLEFINHLQNHVGCSIDVIIEDEHKVVQGRFEPCVYCGGASAMSFMPEDAGRV